ncbi:aminotransferase class I/II-fold pyridoxal phosphate-dependent enzyme [Macellibacteroides fermentans]|jgi:8-amino-7-oxononanoate synthase|uniref:8-amino-7-oxononanoate synthase n=1 Tax=Parabacteroides chartae TaxID=1037355 RepID=A0A1T5EHT7_9BACT|nr:8-amino-7-oxononanoate synthase [Parabacteroides chartae]SKB83592.1 8-amino-7-oxononanoate synthase [Parabacteroides chartae]
MNYTDKETACKQELIQLEQTGNLRGLPGIELDGKWIHLDEKKMLNLSSNDYLGIASDQKMRQDFLSNPDIDKAIFSSSSSRLLTGNYPVYQKVERLLTDLYKKESALVFSSGYHMNMGILPAIADKNTLILADKLVHASIIDGIRISSAQCIRYRHQDYRQLEELLDKHHAGFRSMIIVTESIFSMDGDVSPLPLLVQLKKKYPNTFLYVDEAHAVGVRGLNGLGIAEEEDCIPEIDFLCGTFGKAFASMGGFVVCSKIFRDYLINRMRTFIFTTALPPIQLEWSFFVLNQMINMKEERMWLRKSSQKVKEALEGKGFTSTSSSHILPVVIGDSKETILKAGEMQRKGFYMLPVRPPTVPEGTSRLRISLTAGITSAELNQLIQNL